MSNIRAKFVCSRMEKTIGWGSMPFLYDYHFRAVSDTSPENKSFFAATPSGELKLTAVRDDLFQVGEEYYLDFTSAK